MYLFSFSHFNVCIYFSLVSKLNIKNVLTYVFNCEYFKILFKAVLKNFNQIESIKYPQRYSNKWRSIFQNKNVYPCVETLNCTIYVRIYNPI